MRIALLAALLAAACTSGRAERGLGLPADRSTAVLYVALGDSTVEGVGATRPERNYVGQLHARLRTVYPNARLANLGKGGATSADVLRRQLDRAIELRPNLVTLSIGPNDITTGVAAETYEKNLEAILGRLRHETTAVTIVNLIPDLSVTPRFNRSRHREAVGKQTIIFNEALARTGLAHGAEIVNLYAASQREVPAQPELISSDGYHPSDAGYARWAELVWTGVEARIDSKP
jgi:acyl-CoA thioesterase I